MGRLGFGLAAFLGAFLLFQVQPLVAKALTPLFGGSAMVWTTCMVFFQGSLLAGYLYAHLASRLPERLQAGVHVALLSVAWLALKFVPTDRPADPTADPVLALATLLATSIGPAFVLVAATAPLLQRWYASAFQESPYRLYAISNTGSLLGLLCYPFIIEPALPLGMQERLWAAGLATLAVLFAILSRWLPASSVAFVQLAESQRETEESRPTALSYLNWLLLSAAPSALLLAVTNKISVEIAPIPLLWVVPLSLYLITFIISFDHEQWYRPTFTLVCAIASIVFAGLLLQQRSPHLLQLTSVLYAAMFFCSLLCHGELSRSKPPVRWLTGYFLTISTGGVIGGIAVGLLAPRLFSSYHEMPLSLAACVALGVQRRWLLAPGSASESAIRESWLTGLVLALTGGLAVTAWISPELLSQALGRSVARRGLAMEFIALGAVVLLLLYAVLALMQNRLRRSALSPIKANSRADGRWPTFAWGVATLLTAAAALASCTWAGASTGWSPGEQLGAWTGLLNPVTIWAIGLAVIAGVVSRSGHRPAANATAAKLSAADAANGSNDQISDFATSTAALLPPAAVAFIGATIFSSGLLEGLISETEARWLLALPAAALGLAGLPAVGRWLYRQQVLIAILLVLVSIIPAIFLWRGTAIEYRSAGSFALAAGLASGCLLLAASYVYADAARRRPAFLGFVAGLAGGAILPILAPGAVQSGFVPACAVVAAAVVLNRIVNSRLPASPNHLALVGCAVTACLVGLACGLVKPKKTDGTVLAAERNFYSLLRVVDVQGNDPRRILLHGDVMHGMQWRTPGKQQQPTTYFHPKSGIGQLLSQPSARPRRVYVIGLGVGTIAAYGRPGDLYRFSEIDPKVLDMALKSFDFLGSSQATLDYLIADGRLSLEQQSDEYDVIMVDAFTGDAVPTHLLTAEALDLYLKHLASDGFLAINVTNTHINLTPVVNGHAQRLGLNVKYVDYNVPGTYPRSVWALLSRGEIPVEGTLVSDSISQNAIQWTDHHNGLLPLIRFRFPWSSSPKAAAEPPGPELP